MKKLLITLITVILLINLVVALDVNDYKNVLENNNYQCEDIIDGTLQCVYTCVNPTFNCGLSLENYKGKSIEGIDRFIQRTYIENDDTTIESTSYKKFEVICASDKNTGEQFSCYYIEDSVFVEINSDEDLLDSMRDIIDLIDLIEEETPANSIFIQIAIGMIIVLILGGFFLFLFKRKK